MKLDTQSIQENLKLYETAVIAASRGLLGAITTNLRALGLGFNGKSAFFVIIFDHEPTDEEFDDISAALAEATTHFLTDEAIPDYDEYYLTIPYPENITPHIPNWGLTYLRKEPPK